MSKETAIVKQGKTIRDFMLTAPVQEQIKMALPRHIGIDNFIRTAITTIMQNEKLLQCDVGSLMKALVQSAQLGLSVDGILGHAYLIPYNNRKKGITEAQFQVGYKGLIALARRSGEVQSFNAQVVFENDKFEFAFGLNERLEHIPAYTNRGKMIASYAMVKFKDGGHAFDVMFKEDIEKIKAGSKAKDSGPWKTHETEMWRKTVAKRLAKYLPLSVEFQMASQLDEHNDMGLGNLPSAMATNTEKNTTDLKKELAEPSEVPEAEEGDDCNKDPKTCGHDLSDGKGSVGCDISKDVCPYAEASK